MPAAPHRRLALPTAVLTALGLALLATPPAVAAPAATWHAVDVESPIHITTVPASPARHTAALRTKAPTGPRAFLTTGPTLSTWQVNYDAGFQANPLAEAAFQRAVDLWSLNVTSKAPIIVNASLKALGPGQLGGAGPAGFAVNDGGVYSPASTAYPDALANAIASRQAGKPVDVDPPTATSTGEDIDAEFTTDPTLFSYGADPATVPPTQYDFESVVLHELGHGLGFIGNVEVSPRADGTLIGTYDPGSPTPYPFIYDRLTGTGDGAAVLDRPRGSTAMRDAVTGNNLYWFGVHGSAADRGREPRLYAPSDPNAPGANAAGWQQGSSYSHLSDASYPKGDPDSLMTPFAEPGEAVRDPGNIMLGMFQDMGWETPGLPGSRYTPVPPVRILDTRDGTGQAGHLPVRLGVGSTDLNVETALSGVPSDATAVVLNVTSQGASATTDLRVYPTPRAPGAPVPDVSNLNVSGGQTRANLVTVPVGRAGLVRLRNGAGSTNVLVDLAGFYAPAATTDFHPVTPSRVLDTNTGAGVPGGVKAKIGPGQFVDLTVSGVNGVPGDGSAQAVVLGVTAAFPTGGTDVRVYPTPTDTSVPDVSNINAAAGRNVPNLVIVKIGDGGRVRLRNASSSVTLLADLNGWFGTGTSGSLFRPTRPTRVLDTRFGLGTTGPTRLGAGQSVDVKVRDTATADVNAGVPATATAAVLNLTGVAAASATDVRGYPAPATFVPTVSNLNLVGGQTAADLAILRLGTGGVRLRNSGGSVALLADIAGWFGPA